MLSNILRLLQFYFSSSLICFASRKTSSDVRRTKLVLIRRKVNHHRAGWKKNPRRRPALDAHKSAFFAVRSTSLRIRPEGKRSRFLAGETRTFFSAAVYEPPPPPLRTTPAVHVSSHCAYGNHPLVESSNTKEPGLFATLRTEVARQKRQLGTEKERFDLSNPPWKGVTFAFRLSGGSKARRHEVKGRKREGRARRMQRILFLSIQTRVDRGRLRRGAHTRKSRGPARGRALHSAIEAVREPSGSARAALPLYMLYSPGFRRRKLKS